MDIKLPPEKVSELFNNIDKNRSGEITYNELLNFLRECKREEEKQRKLKFIAERTNLLKEQSNLNKQLQEADLKGATMSAEGRLSMKLAIMQMRESNAN